MVFSSFSFICIFLPVVLLVNRYLKLSWSNTFLFLASLVFYWLGEGQLVSLLLISITWNYFIANLMVVTTGESSELISSRPFLFIGVVGNLLLLMYYKYFGFLIDSFHLNGLLPESRYANILLPLGISFFTFQGISYLIDVYRKEHPPEKSIIKLGLFISFFPQLVAGPIVKYKELATYLSDRVITSDKMVEGSHRFIRGLAKKVIIADQLAIVAEQIFATDTSALPSDLAWLGVLTYGLQIYYDFSGYSDMAIGIGLMLGFVIPENFNHPYMAKTVREFWRRWHISLSSWFRDYLYFPLGGNRISSTRTYLNLMIVFFLTGLWHGASANFIVWGLLHGMFMILERFFAGFFKNLPSPISHIYLILVVGVLWIFFRLEEFSTAMDFFQRLFSQPAIADHSARLYLSPYVYFVLFIGILFSLPLRQKLADLYSVSLSQKSFSFLLSGTASIILLVLTLSQMTVSSYSPFIYFRF